MDNKPCRKMNRLQNFNYSSKGDYFITICTAERKNVFWLSDYDGIEAETYISLLNENGKCVLNVLNKANEVYSGKAVIEKYAIMPDHIHFILYIMEDNSVGVEAVVRNFKRYVSIELGVKKLWQKGFYDHIIRCEKDYNEIWDYIDANPRRKAEKMFLK